MANMAERLMKRLRCAACSGELSRSESSLTCALCARRFPIDNGVPVLIDEAHSLFRIDDCACSNRTGKPPVWRMIARRVIARSTAAASRNLAARKNIAYLAEQLRSEPGSPAVLVLGGASLGIGIESLVLDPTFAVVESDIAIGPRTNLICDAHRIPFETGTFDAVVAQAVLEYLVDPFAAVAEIHRVLRPNGWVYAESPFLQEVHGGAYDFFRFTHVGHRWLFRHFEEADSGISCGPAMALSRSYRSFLRSFARSTPARAALGVFADLSSHWLTRFDDRLQHRSASYDAASAFYFLGRRSETALSKAQVVRTYRGLSVLR